MKIENRQGRVLSVVRQFKTKDGEFVVIVDTNDITDEAWQTGFEQALGAT